MSTFKLLWKTITRRKSMKECMSLETPLNRNLETYHLIFYGLSQMTGAGIFVLLGHIIRDRTGPAANISFFLAGLASAFTALCYCEFSTLIPKAGSSYIYTYIILGELPAFVTGWTILLDFLVSMSSIAKGFSGSVNLLTNGTISRFTLKYLPMATGPNDVWESSADIVAFGLIFMLILISLTGAKISLSINVILACIQVILLSVIIAGCFFYGSPATYIADGGYTPFGFDGIIQGAGIAIFAFAGFECLGNCAEEAKNPKRSLPIAILTCLGIMTTLYLLASSGLSYLVPRLSIDEKSPFVSGFQRQDLIVFQWIAGVGTLLATGASKLTSIYLIPRMFYAVASDGLIFRSLGWIEQRTKAPVVALLFGGTVTMLLALTVRIEILADVTSLGILFSYIIIGIDIFILRYIFSVPKLDEQHDDKLSSDTDDNFNSKLETDSMKMRWNFLSSHMANKRSFIFVLVAMLFWSLMVSLSFVVIFPHSKAAGIGCGVISGLCTVITLGLLTLYEPNEVNSVFSVPLMPFTPFLAIFFNMCMVVNLPRGAWIRFMVWLLIGLIIYFGYGIWNSKLRVNEEDTNKFLIGQKSKDLSTTKYSEEKDL